MYQKAALVRGRETNVERGHQGLVAGRETMRAGGWQALARGRETKELQREAERPAKEAAEVARKAELEARRAQTAAKREQADAEKAQRAAEGVGSYSEKAVLGRQNRAAQKVAEARKDPDQAKYYYCPYCVWVHQARGRRPRASQQAPS